MSTMSYENATPMDERLFINRKKRSGRMTNTEVNLARKWFISGKSVGYIALVLNRTEKAIENVTFDCVPNESIGR